MTHTMKTQPPPTDAPMMISKGRASAGEEERVSELNYFEKVQYTHVFHVTTR